MIDDISFLYSDGAIPEDIEIIPFINRDTIAARYGDSPKNVEDYDPISWSFGLICPKAGEKAQVRLQARQNAINKNRF